MTDRGYIVNQLRFHGLLVGGVLFYAVGLPHLMVRLGFTREFPWLAPWNAFSPYALAGILPLCLWGVWRIYRSVAVRAAQEVRTRFHAGGTYVVLPPLHGESPLSQRFADSGEIWAHIARLLPEGESLIVELVGTPERLCYLVTGMQGTLAGVIPQLMATLPGTQVRPLSPEADPLFPLWLDGGVTACRTLRPRHARRQIHPATGHPILAMVGILAHLPAGVQGGLRLLVRSDADSSLDFELGAESRSIPILNQRNPAYTDLPQMPWESRLLTQKAQDTQQDLRTRAGRHLLDVCVQVWARAPESGLAAQTADRLAQTLQSQYTPANPLTVHPYRGDLADRAYPPFSGRHWTDQELGTLFHFVGKEGYEIAPRLQVSRIRPLPPDPIHYYHAGMQTLPVHEE